MENTKLKLVTDYDDNPVDVTAEVNFIWNIANKLRGTYQPDNYHSYDNHPPPGMCA